MISFLSGSKHKFAHLWKDSLVETFQSPHAYINTCERGALLESRNVSFETEPQELPTVPNRIK